LAQVFSLLLTLTKSTKPYLLRTSLSYEIVFAMLSHPSPDILQCVYMRLEPSRQGHA